MAKKLKIRQVHSAIGRKAIQGRTIRALGFRRLYETITHDDTPQIRGMIAQVAHLVRVEEVNE